MVGPRIPVVRAVKTEILDAGQVARSFPALVRRDTALKALSNELTQQGFSATTGRSAVFGLKETYEATSPQAPPRGVRGAAVSKVVFEMHGQEFAQRGSKDKAAVVRVTVTGGANSETYTMSLVAPKGNFKRVVERYADARGKVSPTRSWWTRFRDCLKGKCVKTCIEALATCPPTSWQAYLLCVLARCGGCGAKCAGCATCRCRWWCKWATGCCKG